jgi:hypothetical protein
MTVYFAFSQQTKKDGNGLKNKLFELDDKAPHSQTLSLICNL